MLFFCSVFVRVVCSVFVRCGKVGGNVENILTCIDLCDTMDLIT